MSCVWKSQNTNNQESASAGNLQSQAYSSKAVHVGILMLCYQLLCTRKLALTVDA